MHPEPQQPATRSASPTPGNPELAPARSASAGPTRRELRLAAERAAAEAAARQAELEARSADDAARVIAATTAAPATVPGAGDGAPAARPLTRRELRAAAAAAAAAAVRDEAADRAEAPSAPVAEPAPEEPAAPPRLPVAPAVGTMLLAETVDSPTVSITTPGTLTPSVSLSPLPTRRELRLKQDAACPPPFPLIDEAPAAAPAARTSGAVRVAKSATVLALSGALLVSGFALQDGASAQAGAHSAAQAAEQRRLHLARVNGAEASRLTSQAEAWAGTQRTRALEVAAAAVVQADAVVQSATPLVQPDAVAPLDDKVAQLEAMINSSEQLEPTVVAPSPEEVLRENAVDRASRSDGRTPLPEEAATATAPPAAPVSPVTDLETTQEMLAIAEQVAQLTAQVQAATEARIAEEAARAAAEAAAAEVARKVAIAQAAPNGDIPTSALCAPAFAPDELLRCDAAAALEQLNEVYRAEFGHDLSVVSSYRSYSMQVATRRSRGGLAATPGTSNHGRAVAVDFGDFGSLGSFRDADYLWMKEHGEQFGWYHPRMMEPGGGGPQEPWHWEYGTDTGWDGPGR